MSEERSILVEHLFLCGDCAMEWGHREFRTVAFDLWVQGIGESGAAVMRTRLVRKGEVTERLVGCAPCWSLHGVTLATYALELTIDGDA